MGVWGFWQRPSQPTDKSDYEREADAMDRDSEEEFIEREMSFEDSLVQYDRYDEYEGITTDEGGWGAWMGGEL